MAGENPWKRAPGQSWTDWRENLPLQVTDDNTGWQTWYNRQGRQWGAGTTTVKRKARRAALQKGQDPLQKGSETKGAGKASSSGGSDTPSERLRLTERPAVTLQERPEEEVKTEEVAVKEENPLQKGSQSWANISETDASGEGANADTHADNEPSSSSKPLKKENAKVVFPFGMNPVVMPANSPVEVPLKKGIASLESTSLSGSAVSTASEVF